jgi:hypothetical protein
MVSGGRRVIRTVLLGMRSPALVLLLACACDKEQPPELPPAEVYVPPVAVHGQWRGEVAGVEGTLQVDDLAGPRYRGMFQASGIERRYVLNMEQLDGPGPDGAALPSNLVRFTWQDGRGDRGEGWLLVNREGSALTGSFGRGDGTTSGAGDWTFVRTGESPPATSLDGGEPEQSDEQDTDATGP